MHRTRSIILAVVAACVALAMLPTMALAISRDLVLDRGKVWVNHTRVVSRKTVTGVPYSQSKWAYENGSMVPTSVAIPSTAGYRTDCSGFVSMAWNLRDSKGRPFSDCTAGFGAKGSKKYFEITKAQLVPGDMMLAAAAWGAPGPHAIIFDGWADAAQTQFWAMEQTSSSSHNGTILHARSYPPDKGRYPKGKSYYKPYRYSGLEDPYSDVEVSVSGADAYRSAAAACDAAYPTASNLTVPAMVIAGAAQQGDQVTAASLAGALKGPMLLTAATSLPASVTAEIKRLKPTRVFLLGSTSSISAAVQSRIAALGVTVVRVSGTNRWQVSAAAMGRIVAEAAASKRPADVAYLANGNGIADALSVSPILAKTGRPLLFVDKDSMPPYTTKALRRSGIKHVIILGSTGAISAKQELALRKSGLVVERIGGANSFGTSLRIAAHAVALKVGFSWKSVGVASQASCADALAWAYANGIAGSMYVLTPTSKLDSTVRANVISHRSEIGKARVYGGSGAVSQAARRTLATALRSGK